MSFDALRVLLVEDNPGDAVLVRRELSRAMPQAHVDTTPTLAGALVHLETLRHDVVLLDLGLPDSAGVDGLRRLAYACPEIPVVVLTGDGRHEQGIEAVAAGAHDFHVKGAVEGSRLALSLRYAVQRNDTQRELTSRAEALRRANERLTAYAQRTAEELREPLSTIRQVADLLEAGLGDPAESLARLRRHVVHGLDLVDAHLREGRVDDRAGDPQGPVDLARLVEEILETLDVADAEVRIGPLPIVSGRGGALRAVLQNLVANAVRHGREEGDAGLVEVSARPVPDGWVVSVEDAGPGVPAHRHDAVFERAARDSDATGHGLGLAGVRDHLEASGQVIWVETSRLGGAAFRFTAAPVTAGVSHTARIA